MASITINFSSAVAQRLAVAFQEALGLDDPATSANIKAYIIADMKQVVRSAEREIARRALEDDDPPTIT